jgi:hypothetical protein
MPPRASALCVCSSSSRRRSSATFALAPAASLCAISNQSASMAIVYYFRSSPRPKPVTGRAVTEQKRGKPSDKRDKATPGSWARPGFTRHEVPAEWLTTQNANPNEIGWRVDKAASFIFHRPPNRLLSRPFLLFDLRPVYCEGRCQVSECSAATQSWTTFSRPRSTSSHGKPGQAGQALRG